jgi:hypothetical protein
VSGPASLTRPYRARAASRRGERSRLKNNLA